jgi:hypothetical protein
MNYQFHHGSLPKIPAFRKPGEPEKIGALINEKIKEKISEIL